jgi:hypothetical protein
MQDDDQFDIGDRPAGKRPWFGPRQMGFGYGPRTWQGFLVTAVLLAFVITVATVTKGRMPWMLFAIVPAIAVPFVIGAVQRR